jgi:hypothetical protein
VGANTFFEVPFPVTSSTASCPALAAAVRGSARQRKYQP